MKTLLITLVLIATHLAVTCPARAQEPAPVKAPQFISKGKPLSTDELTALNQRVSQQSKVSIDSGGSEKSDDAITVALVVIVAIAIIGAVAYGIEETWPFK
jgi:hypothetical protein